MIFIFKNILNFLKKMDDTFDKDKISENIINKVNIAEDKDIKNLNNISFHNFAENTLKTKFINSILNKYKKENKRKKNLLSLHVDEVYINPNYFHLKFINSELKKNKKVALVFEEDLLEKIQPNKIINNSTLLNFYFFYLQNNIKNQSEDNSSNFDKFEYLIRFCKKTNDFYTNKYDNLYSNYCRNSLKNTDTIKKFHKNFIIQAKNFIFYNIYVLKKGKELPFLKIDDKSFYFQNNYIEPNNLFLSELLEMKYSYENNLFIFPYYKPVYLNYRIDDKNEEIICDKFKHNYLCDKNKEGYLIHFKTSKGYNSYQKNINYNVLDKNIPEKLNIYTKNFTEFKNPFPIEKMFLFKNNKKRQVGFGDIVLKYKSKHLEKKINDKNQYILEPFMLKYNNQMFIFGEKIKLDYINNQKRNFISNINIHIYFIIS